MDIKQTIQLRYRAMSPAQKKIADYLLRHGDQFIFQSSSQVAAQLELSESTVVRFATLLGFSKFKELQWEWKKETAKHLDIIGQFNQHAEDEDTLLYPLQQELKNIEETFRELDPEALQQAVELILSARNIGVAAIRGAIAPALVLSQFLNELRDHTRMLVPGSGVAFDVIKNWDERDLIICCEFIPLKGFVYNILNYGKKRGCKTISIAGDLASCLFPASDVILPVKKDGAFISYTATMVLVNLLLHAVSRRNSADTVQSLRGTEQLLQLAHGGTLEDPTLFEKE